MLQIAVRAESQCLNTDLTSLCNAQPTLGMVSNVNASGSSVVLTLPLNNTPSQEEKTPQF